MFLLMLRQDHQKQEVAFLCAQAPGSLAREGDINQKMQRKPVQKKSDECQDGKNEHQEICSAVVEKSRAES